MLSLPHIRPSRLAAFLALLVAGAFFLFAMDLSGRWVGTIDVNDESSGAVISTPVLIQLDQQSSTLSGSVGRIQDQEPAPIRNAHLTGDTLTFEAVSGETSGAVQFTLTIKGDSMEGNMKTKLDSEDITGKVKVRREGK